MGVRTFVFLMVFDWGESHRRSVPRVRARRRHVRDRGLFAGRSPDQDHQLSQPSSFNQWVRNHKKTVEKRTRNVRSAYVVLASSDDLRSFRIEGRTTGPRLSN
jgi:hypothetical protein